MSNETDKQTDRKTERQVTSTIITSSVRLLLPAAQHCRLVGLVVKAPAPRRQTQILFKVESYQ